MAQGRGAAAAGELGQRLGRKDVRAEERQSSTLRSTGPPFDCTTERLSPLSCRWIPVSTNCRFLFFSVLPDFWVPSVPGSNVRFSAGNISFV